MIEQYKTGVLMLIKKIQNYMRNVKQLNDREWKLLEQIKDLIQNYPEVDKEFINSHAEIIFQNTPEQQLNVTIWAERIYQILKDARVNIKEE